MYFSGKLYGFLGEVLGYFSYLPYRIGIKQLVFVCSEGSRNPIWFSVTGLLLICPRKVNNYFGRGCHHTPLDKNCPNPKFFSLFFLKLRLEVEDWLEASRARSCQCWLKQQQNLFHLVFSILQLSWAMRPKWCIIHTNTQLLWKTFCCCVDMRRCCKEDFNIGPDMRIIVNGNTIKKRILTIQTS